MLLSKLEYFDDVKYKILIWWFSFDVTTKALIKQLNLFIKISKLPILLKKLYYNL